MEQQIQDIPQWERDLLAGLSAPPAVASTAGRATEAEEKRVRRAADRLAALREQFSGPDAVCMDAASRLVELHQETELGYGDGNGRMPVDPEAAASALLAAAGQDSGGIIGRLADAAAAAAAGLDDAVWVVHRTPEQVYVSAAGQDGAWSIQGTYNLEGTSDGVRAVPVPGAAELVLPGRARFYDEDDDVLGTLLLPLWEEKIKAPQTGT